MKHWSREFRLWPIQVQPKYHDRDAWKALAEKESLSYEVLELSAPPALNEEGTFAEWKEWYRDSGRVTSVHGCFIDVNPASGDALFRELSRHRCRQSCALAMELRAQNVVFHSSCLSFLRGSYLDMWAGQCAEFYMELAEAFPLNIFIENSQDIDPVPIRELMKHITDPRIGVCLDLGHVNYSSAPLEEWLEALHERIGYLHLSDNPGGWDEHLPLGEGTVDWERAGRYLKEPGRMMPVTLETRSWQDAARSIAFLKKHLVCNIGGVHGQ